MAVVEDVFQLTDRQQQDGQEVLNVYFYRLGEVFAGNAAEGLVTAWIDQVLPAILEIQTDNVVHLEVSARNLYNDSESYSELISEPGDDDSGETFPIFNAVGFRLIGDNSAVRDGAKRYGGLAEGAATDGVIDAPTVLTSLAALALVLIDPLNVGLAAEMFVPIIVKRLADGGGYRLPENQAEGVVSNLVDALFNVEVTSQTSRKIGVGA